MSGALVLVLPGVLCAVMAWDLSRPAATRRRPRLRERGVAAALAISAGSCLLAAVWTAAATRGPGLLDAACLVAGIAATRSQLRHRRQVHRQAAVPAQRRRLPSPAPSTAAPTTTTTTATGDRAQEPA